MAAAAEPRSPERETSGHRARRWATANVTFPSLFGVLFVVAGAISAMFLPVHLPALMLTSDPCANLVRNAACAGCGGLHSSCPRCPVGQSCAADNDCDRSMSANSSFGEVACSASTHLCTDRRTGMQAYTESDTAPTAVAFNVNLRGLDYELVSLRVSRAIINAVAASLGASLPQLAPADIVIERVSPSESAPGSSGPESSDLEIWLLLWPQAGVAVAATVIMSVTNSSAQITEAITRAIRIAQPAAPSSLTASISHNASVVALLPAYVAVGEAPDFAQTEGDTPFSPNVVAVALVLACFVAALLTSMLTLQVAPKPEEVQPGIAPSRASSAHASPLPAMTAAPEFAATLSGAGASRSIAVSPQQSLTRSSRVAPAVCNAAKVRLSSDPPLSAAVHAQASAGSSIGPLSDAAAPAQAVDSPRSATSPAHSSAASSSSPPCGAVAPAQASAASCAH